MWTVTSETASWAVVWVFLMLKMQPIHMDQNADVQEVVCQPVQSQSLQISSFSYIP
uniref:Uncharacterized protein n=1 Tax=Arundo donax TaxID=35708 RepID=A0A0A9D8V6_ARUDO